MHDYKVKTKSSLIEYLKHIGITRTKSRQLLRHRAIGVNGKEVKSLDHILLKGDRVSISKDKKSAEKVLPRGIKLIYEDDVLIIVEKPYGLLTIATDTEKTKTLYFQLNEFLRLRSPLKLERVFIVHRLDRDTSGLIMFAKNEKIKRILQNNWKQVEKRYCAFVEGTPAKKESVIKSRLKETKSLKVVSGSHSDESKLSKTRYKVLKPGKNYTLLDIQLETGRKNQIRVHLADIGHPVVGDKKYGAKTNPFKRLGLHSYVLSFKHPSTGKPLRFESKIPFK